MFTFKEKYYIITLLELFETTQQVKIRQWYLSPVRIQLEKVCTDSVLFYFLY